MIDDRSGPPTRSACGVGHPAPLGHGFPTRPLKASSNSRGPPMSFGRFRLISQLGAGRDGVRYRATDRQGGATVEVLILSGAREDPARWPVVARRLRTAALIDHP